MAVEMVRKPSETPNIENIDDFMPIRYAYANQNGYVIGRGRIGTGIDTEAYTINGNTFTINSGRLVLQGVECDIGTEHSIVIDVNATKRYYAVYLQVNLATNTSDIFVTYDTLGIPSVDEGDDLTTNQGGTARIVLFTFEATNGIISNVTKVIKACEYSIPYKLDEKGILKIGDIVIPQRKLVWTGNKSLVNTELGVFTDVSGKNISGRTFEFVVSFDNSADIVIKVNMTKGSEIIRAFYTHSQLYANMGLVQAQLDARYLNNTLYIKGNEYIITSLMGEGTSIDYLSITLKSVYEIIE